MDASSPLGFWSGETLLARGKDIFSDFNPDQIDCNSYTLLIGDQYYRTGIGGDDFSQKTNILKEKESFIIPAGQFAFLISKENVNIPDSVMAFISMRTPIKLRGLINVSGFNVDPGYKGQLVYAVYNASPSPVHLKQGDPAFKIWLCSLDRPSKSVFSKNKGLHEITNEMVQGMNRDVLSLKSLSDKVDLQQQEIKGVLAEQKPTIDNLHFISRAISTGVVIAFIGGITAACLTYCLPIIWRAEQATSERIWLPQGDSKQMSPKPEQPIKHPAPTQPDDAKP